MNWWLVANHLKHGMMTVRPMGADGHDHAAMSGMEPMAHDGPAMSQFVALAAGFAIAVLLAPR